MQLIGHKPSSIQQYRLAIHEECKAVILYQLSEAEKFDDPDEHFIHYWIHCPGCGKKFEVNKPYILEKGE